ncbi:hypothetical protein Y1Q_0020387 [Alligator mississippiensis]|uniref:Uncharacterized protein n=1 Tax=Alligator mississippiensis TaxID=8496 RepID=A0A151N7D6_ALLMI|nr:hypothetical protein Y1Q_0020387 [Alligator mississippiensis]
MDLVKGSLDRKLQRPLLGKSRTLPSIPQSPVLSRVPLLDSKLYREDMPEQKQYKNHSASDCQKGCTVPSTGEAWRLEDDCMDSVGDPALRPQLRTAVDEAPFSYFRTRSFYMRKSLSVDNHLSSLSYSIHPSETKAERVKTKLRRQFDPLWMAFSLPLAERPSVMCEILPETRGNVEKELMVNKRGAWDGKKWSRGLLVGTREKPE